jgi:hypothetical protein
MYPESTPAEWLFHQEKATLRTIARAQLLWFCSKAKLFSLSSCGTAKAVPFQNAILLGNSNHKGM